MSRVITEKVEITDEMLKPSKRLIDADALMKTLGITDMDCDKCAWCDKEWSRCKRGSDFEDACCAIENAPTIEERKRGEWIPEFDGKFTGGAYWFSCSKCKRIVPEVRNGGWNFCPNCGADMRQREE